MNPRPPAPASPFGFRPLHSLRFALIVALGFALLNFALTANHPNWQSPAGWARAIGTSAVFAICIRLAIDLMYMLGARSLGARFHSLKPWQRALFHWGTPMLGLAIGLPLASWLVGIDGARADAPQIHLNSAGAVAFMALVMALFYGYFAIRARQLRAERQAAEAQLRLLQAQMEPHFLFNTLANVVSLMESDTPRAKRMLESFTDYLRASLASLRRAEQTLGDELALCEAYLHIAKTRMEDRLHYRIDVPEALRSMALPSLSLQPLIENAVLHGLEPQIDGGSIIVSARLDGGALVLEVSDDGLGLDAAQTRGSHGSGTALDNIRQRLMQTYGARGGLQVEAALPRGVRATLRLPAAQHGFAR